MPSDKTLDVRPGSLGATAMRYHELWLQRWLYSKFFVREGYPVPVVFGTPMDAFANFKNLWADEQNPFKYLLDLKDERGTPLYQPYPAPVRYPLISVMRKGQKMRPYQNFSIHRFRHINWPTVSDTGPVVPGKEQLGTDLVKCDLGNVTTSRMPMAWDFRFQVDHFCLRPDSQAFFLEKLLNQFWRGGGQVQQTWMTVEYPGWGTQYIRIYVEGEIDQSAPEDSQFAETNVEYRTAFTLLIEGFDVDLHYKVEPVLWKYVYNVGSPDQLDRLLDPVVVDIRAKGTNLVLESRLDIPSAGTCQTDGIRNQYLAAGTAYIVLGDLAGTQPGDNVYDPNQNPPGYPTDPIIVVPAFSYGIASTLQFGIPIFTSGTQAPSWLSGAVSPAAPSIGIEVPGVGTFLTAANGSYFGLIPFNYSGTAIPHYFQAASFSPPVRVYANVIADTPNQDYSWSASALQLTDSLAHTVTGGNVSSYDLFDYVNPASMSAVAFGTHFAATVPVANGTETMALSAAAFGTHQSVVVFANPGTDPFNLSATALGTHLRVSFSGDGGTDATAMSATTFGTALQVLFQANGGTDAIGVLGATAFGTYA